MFASRVFRILSCAAGFGPLSCRWTKNCAPLCSRCPLSDSGGVGSVNGYLPRPGITRCTALTVPQIEPNGASGIGRGKRGVVCRKSTPEKAAYIKAFRIALDGWLIHFTSDPSNGPLSVHKWEVNKIADYMTADTKLLPYLPYPRFLLEADLTQTAKVLYAVLLDRTNLSRANGWTDEGGNIFVVFPLNKLADWVNKGPSTVKNALNELEVAELIERRRCGNGMPNRIYVKQPDSQDIDRLMDKKLATRQPENWPLDSQKTGCQIARKLAPNKIRNSNLKNNLSRVSESAHARGRYGNIFLTEAEVDELQADFPTIWQEYIERLSEYMASTGKTYKSHAATIRRWAKEDRRKGKGVSDYSCKECESL